MQLQARNDIHLARRVWHSSGVFMVYLLYWHMTYNQAVTTVLIVCACLVALDFARLWSPALNKFFTWLLGPFMRESERHQIAGSTYMVIGIAISVVCFPKKVVLLMLLFFATADPLASYFGIRYGKDKLIGNKTLQGSMAAFVACFVMSAIYLSRMDMMRERLFIVCFLGGLIGAVSELAPGLKWDDNFVFPVVSSTLLTGLFYIFGGLA